LERPSCGSKQQEENRTLALPGRARLSRSREMVEAENFDFVANVSGLLHRAKMSEEAFSVTIVGLFGIYSGDTCSWDQQSLLLHFCT
jgi:hypothetical protein